jgi:hypothetical protein
MSETYRRRLLFYLGRAMDRMRNKRRRQAVIKHLRDRRYVLSLYLQTPNGDKHLGEAQLVDYQNGELVVGVFSSSRLLEEADLSGRRVRVFHRPFNVAGERVNAFETYVVEVRRRDSQRQDLSLLSPLAFEHTPRRRFERRRVRDGRAFQCKLWLSPEQDVFWTSPEDVSVGDASRDKKNKTARIVNISQGGMSLAVHPVQLRRSMSRGVKLGLALKAYDVEHKDYRAFLIRARTASVRRDPSGMLLVGMEFRARASRKSKGGELVWSKAEGGVPEVGRIIEAMDNQAARRSKGQKSGARP